jgi:hypothetical protein
MNEGTTHYAGCIQAGPKHYECALQEIGRLRGTIMDLRVKLEAADNRNTAMMKMGDRLIAEREGKQWVGLTKEELQTIFNYEPNDINHIAFLVESLCKEKNGG